MDKILSARVDEVVLSKISYLAHKLRVSKKKVIEKAVEMYSKQMETAGDVDVFVQTSGAWKRKEGAEQTVNHARRLFKQSMERSKR